jgi:inhibitor of the pro-sigma K processing machinery
MEIIYTVALVAAVAVALYVLFKILAAPIKWVFKLLINAVIGFVLLFLANIVGGFFNFEIPVNLLTCVISGVFGVPGVIFLVVVLIFFW